MSQRFVATVSISLFLVAAFFLFQSKPSSSSLTPVPSVAAAGQVSSARIPSSVQHIPILMYHYIEDHDDVAKPTNAGLFISPTIFETQIQWLADNGYHTISLDDMVQIYQHKMTAPDKPVVLTFDDGWEDSYTNVLPILQKHQMTGTFFIITGFLKKSGFVTADQVKEMAKDGMTIEAHTVDHLDLSKISESDAQYEMGQSKKTLEALLGTTVLDIAYPSGRYNAKVIAFAKKLGYVTAVTTHPGISSTSDHLFELPRVRMTKNSKMAELLKESKVHQQSSKANSSSMSHSS